MESDDKLASAFSELQICDIIQGGKFRYPSDDDFMEKRAAIIALKASEHNLSIIENKSIQWQHRFSFSNENGQHATISLWFGKNGYTGKTQIIQASDTQFGYYCNSICNEANLSYKCDYNPEGRTYATILFNHIVLISHNLDIEIVNVIEGQWHDTYYLKTDGLSTVQFHYNCAMRYTSISPLSSLGRKDEKLKKFLASFEAYRTPTGYNWL